MVPEDNYQSALITDPGLAQNLIRQRQESRGDRFDEVWDGQYLISTLADNEHQHLALELTMLLHKVVCATGLGKVFLGANISDRETNWEQNYRCPDVLVFLNDCAAQDRHTHWYGGPDLAIEVMNQGDRSYEKLSFYASVNTHEVLIIDRTPWALTLFRLIDGEMLEIARSTPFDDVVVESEVLSLKFRLRQDDPHRVQIEVEDREHAQQWQIAAGR